MENPFERCSEDSISPIKALKGSIEIFIEAFIIQSVSAVIYKAGELRMEIKAIDTRIAPVRKYGRLRTRQFHILSLM